MSIRTGYKYKIIPDGNGGKTIVYFEENGTEFTREPYESTQNNFAKMNAEELAKAKSEMDEEYIFLKNRENEMDTDYDNLMARQTELLNE